MALFDTQAAISAFYHDFPDAAGEIFFLDAGSGKSFDEALRVLPAGVRADCRLDGNLVLAYTSRTPFPYAMIAGDRKAAVIVLPPAELDGQSYHESLLAAAFRHAVPPEERPFVPSLRAPAPRDAAEASHWLQFFFDHETAHALLALSAPQTARWHDHALETQADLYATMRHYQRFGTATGFDETLAQYRAQPLLYNLEKHMTAISLRALAGERDLTPWADMSAHDCLQHSVTALGRYYPPLPQIEAMSAVAGESRQGLDAGGFPAALAAFGRAAREQSAFPRTLADDCLSGVAKFFRLDPDTAGKLDGMLHDTGWTEGPVMQ